MMFHPINNRVIGNKNNPCNQIIPKTEIINIINMIELERPDLKDNNGNFINLIGLTIKIPMPATSIRAVLGSP